ncbi:MAG: ATP-binding protein, partial [Spirochaetia bacterium]|nr:ATP-binding protein [Spirochaetia bacterium]
NISDQQISQIQEITHAGEHLLELINEVLDLTKIESGKIDLSLESVDVGELISESITLIDPLARAKNIKIQYDEKENIYVYADRIRLKQILINLLSNAVKYNQLNGSIEILINYQEENDRFQVRISDTGLGIPEDKQPDLFQPFNRFVDENQGIEGTGIGLAITKKLVELMKGNVGVESRLNQGSTFWIELKRSYIEHHSSYDSEKNDSEILRFHKNGKNIKQVIYIEDNPVNLKLVSGLFAQRPQYNLTICHNPGKGIELIHSNQPDLILVDILMPEMDGFQILEIVRANHELKDIPVIAITANAMKEDVVRGLKAGFNEYLAKPINVPKFYDIIDYYLNDDE